MKAAGVPAFTVNGVIASISAELLSGSPRERFDWLVAPRSAARAISTMT